MPYTQLGIPWQGRSSIAAHASYQSAASVTKAERQTKRRCYLQQLQRVGRATDHEMAQQLGWPLSSVCSIRNACVQDGDVEAADLVTGPYGKPNARWRVRREHV